MKIGNLELSENLFCVDMQGCCRTRCRTHFDYFGELCVYLVQFMRDVRVANFSVGGEYGVMIVMDYQF